MPISTVVIPANRLFETVDAANTFKANNTTYYSVSKVNPYDLDEIALVKDTNGNVALHHRQRRQNLEHRKRRRHQRDRRRQTDCQQSLYGNRQHHDRHREQLHRIDRSSSSGEVYSNVQLRLWRLLAIHILETETKETLSVSDQRSSPLQFQRLESRLPDARRLHVQNHQP
ncbi:MAG: hypothetical protein MZU97_24100 [Bacillus subtilis]|nr:hypothetical protein [Bacillus subtilis]